MPLNTHFENAFNWAFAPTPDKMADIIASKMRSALANFQTKWAHASQTPDDVKGTLHGGASKHHIRIEALVANWFLIDWLC